MGFVHAISLLCVACLVTVSAQTSESFVCTKPPEGDWIVEHNFPVAPGNNTLYLQARSILTLQKEVIPNVYSGSGSGVASNSLIPIVPVGAPFSYKMLGIFNPETCVMTGTVFSFDTGYADPVIWTYDGEKMSGPYINSDYGTVMFTTPGRHDVYPLFE